MTHPIRRALRLLLLLAILLPGLAAGQAPPEDPLAGVAQLIFSGKIEEAQTRLRDALQTYEVLEDRQGQALCHILLGFSQAGANDPAAARASLELGAGMLEAEGDAFGAWMALHLLGELEKSQGRFDTALASYDRALALVRQAETSTAPFSLEGFKNLAGIFGMPVESLGPLLEQPQVVKPALLRMAELLTRGSRGGALVEAGRLDEAEADLARATTLSRAFGGMLDAPVASHIGDLRRRQGRFDEARESYRKALGGMKSLPDAPFKGEWAETHILGQLADIELLSGQPDAALAWNDQALGKVRGNAFREAPLLQDRANLLLRSERLDEAGETFARALDIARTHEDVYRQATILADLGSLEFVAGHYQKSAGHFETSLQLLRDLRQPSTEGFVWTLLAQTYLALGAHGSARSALDKAQELTKQSGFHFAAALAEFIAAADRHLAGEMSLEALEQSVQKLFQLPEAGGLLLNQDTMAVLREVMGLGGSQKPADPGAIHGLPQVPALARFHLGKLRLQSGDLTGARELWLQALDGSPNQDLKASLLAAVGMTYLKQGQPDEAIGSFSQAVKLIEGSDVQVEELMTSYLGDERRIFHELLVETLVHQGRFPEAFHAAEQARARAFLQQIGNRRLRPAEGGDARLAAEAENLRVQIPVLERQVQLAPPPEQARRASDLALARDRYQALLVRLKVSKTEYSAVTRVETVQVQDLQREIPPETTLISYYVSSLGTRAWVIDRETFQHVALSLSAADLQSVICRADEIGRRSGTDTVSRGVAVPDARCVAGTATSEELYEKLIAPLRPHIRHSKLVLIPHGPLHYLPFAALRDPEIGRYLIEQHTLTYLPSASALRHLRAKETPVQGRTLVLGDPTSAAPNLEPLPAAQKEAALVANAFTTSPALGTQAAESRLYELGGEVDLLHIAAHGIYEPANPLFSRIALAPGAHHDGNLEVHEILGAVDLTGVNLVVLSACQTAAGERSGGDEIVGLTRAVLYAGSPGVISTLWQIHDTASAVLMEGFYDHLRKGLPAAEALRQAQLSLLAHPLYSQPYYWAAFSLSGDPQGRWEQP
jgi:CHAT domain-containing protein/Flp pilus assembly protein TadD